jgi:hypothetical protein
MAHINTDQKSTQLPAYIQSRQKSKDVIFKLSTYYMTDEVITLIKKKNLTTMEKTRLLALIDECARYGIKKNVFINMLIDEYKFCVDCYYHVLTKHLVNIPPIVDSTYKQFDKHLKEIGSIDPYTLDTVTTNIRRQNASIEHILPQSFSKNNLGLNIEKDYHNLCYVNKEVNTMRSNHRIRFEKKSQNHTTKIFLNGKQNIYDSTQHVLHENISSLEEHEEDGVSVTYFCPPEKSKGFIARKIMYGILQYMNFNGSNLHNLYKYTDFGNLLFYMSNNYNIEKGSQFEFLSDEYIKNVELSSNLCIIDPYFVIHMLFNRSGHTH